MREGMRKLRTYPRPRLVEEPLCRLHTSELGLYQSIGSPTAMTDPADSDPRLFWDLEWHCGMVMGLRFHQLTEELSIQLDRPDVAHALRHLGVEAHDLQLLQADDPDRFAQLCEPPDLGWELWRAERDGAERRYKRGLSQRDAECWAVEAEDLTGRRHWAKPAD